MCELDEIKGVDIGETYRNEKQVVNFVHYAELVDIKIN
jgi:hypothetical protein